MPGDLSPLESQGKRKEPLGKDTVKLCPETQQNCLKLLLIASTKVRTAPKGKPKSGPFKTTYGKLFPKVSHSSSPPNPEVSLAIKYIINSINNLL